MVSLFQTIKLLLQHPIGRRKPWIVLSRWVRWQFGSRILGWPIICPFFGQTRLILANGMRGATMNLYVGFQEFHDMCFVVHFIRSEDLFLDVGANVGVYSILAGSLGAQVIAVEPVPITFCTLIDNIRLNALEDRVAAHNIGLCSKKGELKFTSQYGPMNRVILDPDSISGVTVPVNCLDNLLQEDRPSVVKIDVEGYESEVLSGAQDLLSQKTLLAVILELNGSGKRYGFDDDATDAEIRRFGFKPAHYQPFERKLTLMEKHNASGNTLYVRTEDILIKRLKTAPKINVLGITL